MNEKIKQHWQDNKKTYIAIGITTVGVAGITVLIMRKPQLLRGCGYSQGEAAVVDTPKPQVTETFSFANSPITRKVQR